MKVPKRKSVVTRTPEWPSGWWDHWWKDSPLFKRPQKGHTVELKTGAEFWYEHYWKPRELGVWAYELVRRRIKLRLRSSELTGAEDKQLSSLPPYNQLDHNKKVIFLATFFGQMDGSDRAIQRSLEFKNALEEPWLDGQPNKLGDWRQVEDIDAGFDAGNPTRRKAPISYIKRYLQLVLIASEAAGIGGGIWDESEPIKLFSTQPPTKNHALTEWCFSKEEWKPVIKWAES
jgi:hypothetical protein